MLKSIHIVIIQGAAEAEAEDAAEAEAEDTADTEAAEDEAA